MQILILSIFARIHHFDKSEASYSQIQAEIHQLPHPPTRMCRFFELQANSTTPDTSNNNNLRTISPFQGTTHFAQQVFQLPDRKRETAAAKYVLDINDQGVADLQQFGPPVAMRQILFNKWTSTPVVSSMSLPASTQMTQNALI